MTGALAALHAVIGKDDPHLAWWQMCVRALVIFAVGIALIRVSGKRTFSRETPLDIVVTIIIGSNLSRAITGSAAFLPTIAASAVMVLAYRALTHLCQRLPALGHLLKGGPTILARNGVLDEKAMRREAIARDDVDEALRGHGLETLDGVERLALERNGRMSVIRR